VFLLHVRADGPQGLKITACMRDCDMEAMTCHTRPRNVAHSWSG
jgi:hypothetical protein